MSKGEKISEEPVLKRDIKKEKENFSFVNEVQPKVQKILETPKTQADAWNNHGRLFLKEAKYAEAFELFYQALKLNYFDRDVWIALHQVYQHAPHLLTKVQIPFENKEISQKINEIANNQTELIYFAKVALKINSQNQAVISLLKKKHYKHNATQDQKNSFMRLNNLLKNAQREGDKFKIQRLQEYIQKLKPKNKKINKLKRNKKKEKFVPSFLFNAAQRKIWNEPRVPYNSVGYMTTKKKR